MIGMEEKLEIRSLNAPDEVRVFDKGRLEFVSFGAETVCRAVFQPGWRWSTSVRHLAMTRSCEVPHFQYVVSGRLRIAMDDGREELAQAGDVIRIPPGHDAWVEGTEAVMVVDFLGDMQRYANPEGAGPRGGR